MSKLNDVFNKTKNVSLVLCIFGFVFLGVDDCKAQDSTNYILSETYLSKSSKIQQYEFFDGLGRSTITANNGIDGSGKFSYTLKKHSGEGNVVEQWLPVLGNKTIETKTIDDIQRAASSDYSDSYAYDDSEYDALNRPIRHHKAGQAWKSKPATTTYVTNAANDVKRYLISASNTKNVVFNGYYPKGTLHGICYTDEDGVSISTYTDAFDRKVLERRGNGCDTYYVYDDLGRLTFVLQPMYQQEANADKYAYLYEYDLRGNLIKKKLPGCDAIEYVYDKYDRCVSIQDGELRKKGKCRFMLYDKMGRLALQGLANGNLVSGSLSVVDHACNIRMGICGTDYRGAIVPLFRNSKIDVMEIVNYYDDYSFLDGTNKAQFQGISRPDSSVSKGQLTGTLRLASNGETTAEVYAYDLLGNKTQTQSRALGSVMETQTNTYTYTNKPATLEYTLRPMSGKTLTYSIRNEYSTTTDALMGVSYRAKADTAAIKYWTLRYLYDNHGRVSAIYRPKDLLHFKDDYKYRVDYGYDIHGWTRSITGKRFSERVFYEDGQGMPAYSGNISGVAWSRASSSIQKGYCYSYDGQGRLASSEYGEQEFSNNLGRYDEGLYYDANGNITRIVRNGLRQDGTYGAIDSLRLSYNGNQLKSVLELAQPVLYAGSMDVSRSSDGIEYNANGSLIKDLSRGIVSIEYDAGNNPKQIVFDNGDMTRYVYSAAGQKLRTIHYKSFKGDSPSPSLAGGYGASDYLYVDSTDYMLDGNVVCSNGRLYCLLFDGGILLARYAKKVQLWPGSGRELGNGKSKSLQIGTPSSSSDDQMETILHLYFYYKDHLGNNREVVDESGDTYQSTDYYPYGMPFLDRHSPLQAILQPYKYNGKELDLMSGLNTYDYGGRQYYSAIPMWDRVDPLCEDDYHTSPYAYCLGRPTMLIDFDGYKPTEEEAARIADHVYGNGDVMLIGGWRVSKRKFENVNYIDDGSGFKSKLYERTIDGKTEYVYATAGTDGLSMKDWKNNVQQFEGKSQQYKISKYNAEKISDALYDRELTFVGHSLGGGLAAANAANTSNRKRLAMTFNAAWVSSSTVPNSVMKNANIDAYVNIGDELYYIQMRNFKVRANGNFHWRYGRRSLLGHSIKNFYSSDSKVFNQYYKSIQSLYIQNSSFSPFTF